MKLLGLIGLVVFGGIAFLSGSGSDEADPPVAEVEVAAEAQAAGFAQVQDGVYESQAKYKKRSYTVKVEVAKKRVTKIEATRIGRREDKYDKRGKKVLPRIIDAQSLEVDVKTGATPISKSLTKAVGEALEKAPANQP